MRAEAAHLLGHRAAAQHVGQRVACPPAASGGSPASAPAAGRAKAARIPGAAAHRRRSAGDRGSKSPSALWRCGIHRRRWRGPFAAICANGRRRGRSTACRSRAPGCRVPGRQSADARSGRHERPGADRAGDDRRRHDRRGFRRPARQAARPPPPNPLPQGEGEFGCDICSPSPCGRGLGGGGL